MANVTEEFDDFELVIDLSRCSFDMKSCDRYPAPVVSNPCRKIELKNQFYSKIIESIEPPMKCPIKFGVYEMKYNSYEFPKAFSYFPFDGYVWLPTFKFIDKNTKKAKACVKAEVKVIRKRIRD